MFKYFILLSAIFISICAAWFSVSGIAQLFVGAPLQAMVMAISLELGKLVAVSFVYRYWINVTNFLRWYMAIGAIILSIITSAGIYGYLSAAYSAAAVDFTTRQNQYQVVEAEQASVNDIIAANNSRLQNNQTRTAQLQQYRSQQENRLDSLMGRQGFLTQQSIVRQADNEIRNLQADSRTIERENQTLIARRDSLGRAKVAQQTDLQTNSKLGTFWYISNTIGVPLDKIVKWFVLIIVFVFDPMALALILAYNFLVKKTLTEFPIYNKDTPAPPKNKLVEIPIPVKEEETPKEIKPPSKPRPRKKKDDAWPPARMSMIKAKKELKNEEKPTSEIPLSGRPQNNEESAT